MKKIIAVLLTALISVVVISCDDGGSVVVPQVSEKPEQSENETSEKTEKPKETKPEKPQNIQGYIGMKKTELQKLFGKKGENTDFFHVPYYAYASDPDIEFSFGIEYASYSEVPSDAKCFSVVTKVKHLIDCTNGVSQRKLEEALGMTLEGPEYSDEIGYYVYGGRKGEAYCTVVCAEERMHIAAEDYVSYSEPQYEE